MKKYSTLLFDMDNTIFDFDKDEKCSLIKTFEQFGIPANEKTISRYSEINDSLWKRFEKGEITKEDIKNTRFKIFLDEFGFDYDASPRQINDHYAEHLSHSGHLIEGSFNLCKELKNHGYKIYIVTNGIERTQRLRIKKTGLDEMIEGIFISEAIGYQKPMPQFFTYVFNSIEEKDKNKMLLIGDSLSSDIKGALQSGIDCIWYNRKSIDNTFTLLPTYEVSSINEIRRILL